jgi:predicted aldo/keto reductase-like oxidoreductase
LSSNLGGRLYAPSNKLRDLCLPDMEPMTYASVWLWQHAIFDGMKAPIHTFTVGAARPSDLDQSVLASLLLLQNQEDVAERRQRVTDRLSKAMEEALGKKWVETWHTGLPNAYESKYQTHHTGIVWTYNLIKAWGMLDFAKDRYGPMENCLKNWSAEKTKEDNLQKMGAGFGWTPGVAVTSSLDYTPDFADCPEENRERLMEAIQFVHEWASKKEEGEEQKTIPMEWEAAYDMRPWIAFPERS